MFEASASPPPQPASRPMPNKDVPPDANTLRILVATDNHLGYLEKDALRGSDSFNTFEEILQLAIHYQVDFLLLGGDLFHDNTPSMTCFHRCIKLLREYCLNERPVHFQMLSNPKTDFKGSQFDHANYEDPHLNVGLPVFTIHGNHDDPLGPGGTCAVDLLHDAGLVNLFGRYHSVEEVTITPLLLRKGNTKLALYGLGAVRDSRLNRLFVANKVTFLRPAEETEDWFSMLVFHQNRVGHGAMKKNHIPESFLVNFLDLVIWGHEHECRLDPEWNSQQQFYVSQPGSSVATSLSEGEAVEKFVGLLEVHGRDFYMHKLKLQSVRPFFMEDVVLGDVPELTTSKDFGEDLTRRVQNFLAEKIQSLLERVDPHDRHPLRPNLPLIRLRVDFSDGFEMFSGLRFGQKFVDKVANPNELLKCHRRKEQNQQSLARTLGGAGNLKDVRLQNANVNSRASLESCVETLVKGILTQAASKMQLMLLAEKELSDGVQACVNKNSNDAIDSVVQQHITSTKDHLQQKHIAADTDAVREICRLKVMRERIRSDNAETRGGAVLKAEPAVDEAEDPAVAEHVESYMAMIGHGANVAAMDETGDIGMMDETASTAKRGGRGSRGGRGGTGTTRGRGGRGRGKAAQTTLDTFAAPRGRGRGGASSRVVIDEDDAIAISGSDDDESSLFSTTSSSVGRNKVTVTPSSSRKRATVDSDEDNDDFSFDFRRQKRGK